jgi:hypothetical protein
MGKMRAEVGTGLVWVAIDETTDAAGKFLANVLVGKLEKDAPSLSHLLASKELPVTNHATIVRLMQDCFRKINGSFNIKYNIKKSY